MQDLSVGLYATQISYISTNGKGQNAVPLGLVAWAAVAYSH